MSDDTVDLHVAWMQGKSRTWPRRKQAADDTISGRRFALRQLANWLPFGLCYASHEQIAAWVEHLEDEGKAGNTIYSYQSHVEGFYAWATDERATEYGAVLDGNPALGIPRHRRPPGIPRPVTEAELDTLLHVPEPLLTAVILGAFEGLRRGEMTRIRRERVTEGWMTVDGKGGSVATVAVHPYTWEHIKDRPPGWLVCRPGGAALTRAALSCLARREFDRLGLTETKLHQLRHRYGTLIQRTHRDLLVTKRALRHSQISNTLVYCAVADDDLQEAVHGLPVPGRTGPASL